jgi:hypothetical protein
MLRLPRQLSLDSLATRAFAYTPLSGIQMNRPGIVGELVT